MVRAPGSGGGWLLALVAVVSLALGLIAAACGAAAAARTESGGAATSAAAEQIAREATWAPGQLDEHFQKHGREGPYPSVQAYDAGARETIRNGRQFTYLDRESNARRQGFYDPPSNRFTAVTSDGRRITTHFKPDTGERYVRGLAQSSYR